MKTFKNALAAEYDYIDVVYVKAEKNPNEKFYFECLPQEIDYAVKTGAVVESYKNTFTREAA